MLIFFIFFVLEQYAITVYCTPILLILGTIPRTERKFGSLMELPINFLEVVSWAAMYYKMTIFLEIKKKKNDKNL